MRVKRSTQGLWMSLSIVVVILITAQGHAQQPSSRREFMRKKLEYSKNVLEGLSLEDFGLIARNARALKSMSEVATWRDSMIPNPQDYIPYTMEFQRQADELMQKANKSDLDGASLAYNQLTLTCVRCHKYARLVTK
jgi:hypothetical protein